MRNSPFADYVADWTKTSNSYFGQFPKQPKYFTLLNTDGRHRSQTHFLKYPSTFSYKVGVAEFVRHDEKGRFGLEDPKQTDVCSFYTFRCGFRQARFSAKWWWIRKQLISPAMRYVQEAVEARQRLRQFSTALMLGSVVVPEFKALKTCRQRKRQVLA